MGYLEGNPDRKGKPISEMRSPCQIEKDERFWTMACLMSAFHSTNRLAELGLLFRKAFGDKPPFGPELTWEDYLKSDLHLFFEPNLPSAKGYTEWLRGRLEKQQCIPYVRDSDDGRKSLEGPTNVDALMINAGNGFAVVIEAKVLSDISYQITYDVMRNQIARNIDVMLEENESLCPPLNKRIPSRTLFLLVTPRIFQENPTSRLYGYKFNDYKSDPASLGRDLPHRVRGDWKSVSKRLGWVSWEDFREINGECCKWLD
jgi:hypothetical protein